MRIEGCRGDVEFVSVLHISRTVRDDMQDIYPLFAECDTIGYGFSSLLLDNHGKAEIVH